MPARLVISIVLILNLCVGFPAFAAPSDQLAQVDLYIQSNELEKALTMLLDYSKSKPDQFAEVQARIFRINRAKKAYVDRFSSLVDFLIKTRSGTDSGYEPWVRGELAGLATMDKNNPVSASLLKSLANLAEAYMAQDAMVKIMETGSQLLEADRFSEAAAKYQEGLGLLADQFAAVESGNGANTIAELSASKASVLDTLARLQAMQKDLSARHLALAKAFDSGQLEEVQAASLAFLDLFGQIQMIRQTLSQIAVQSGDLFTMLAKPGRELIEYKNPDYVRIMLVGRPDSLSPELKPKKAIGTPEGMAGAVFDEEVKLLKTLYFSISDRADKEYSQLLESFDKTLFGTAKTKAQTLSKLIDEARIILSNWDNLHPESLATDPEKSQAMIALADAHTRRLAHMSDMSLAWSRVSGIAFNLDALKSSIYRFGDSTSSRSAKGSSTSAQKTPSAQESTQSFVNYSIPELLDFAQTLRSSLERIRGECTTELDGLAELRKDTAAATAVLAGASDTWARLTGIRESVLRYEPAPMEQLYESRLTKFVDNTLRQIPTLSRMADQLVSSQLQQEIARTGSKIAYSQSMLKGEISQDPERNSLGYRDPQATQALSDLLLIAKENQSLGESILAWQQSLDSKKDSLRSEEDILAAKAELEIINAQFAEVGTQRQEAETRARAQISSAASTMKSATQSLDKVKNILATTSAQAAASKGGDSQAITAALDSAESLLESAYSNIVLSSITDFKKPDWNTNKNLYDSLSKALNSSRRSYIFDETLRLLSQGQTEYGNGLYVQASDTLVAAQNLWRSVFDADQEQVAYWLNLIRQANNAANKREVKPNDPLYYDVSNYLDEARKQYQNGSIALVQGNLAKSTEYFNSARTYISYVISVSPLNAEAGILRLRIQKTTDPKAYQSNLPNLVQAAIELNKTDALGAYSQFSDLYALEPNYPGLKANLEKSEIALGLRKAPPTDAEIRQAQELLVKTKANLATGKQSDLVTAAADIATVLSLNPSNQEALSVYRDILILQGKTSGPELNLAARAQLDRAVNAFAARQYNQSRDQLSSLLNNQSTRTREVLKLDADLKTLGY